MQVDVLAQAAVMGQGILLGAALGLVYDLMRAIRRSLRRRSRALRSLPSRHGRQRPDRAL